jgi:very-short-patch-repair endonuclease
MPDLQEQLYKCEGELRRLATQIIEKEAWAAQCERTGLQERQTLMGYVQAIRKIGKGTGKRTLELLGQARRLLGSARRAVPVWIMPLSRVYENFDPQESKFDVVIIDEASQSDVTAMAALYLGREHVVVGDKEQVTPDAIGQVVEQIQKVIATELQGVPNNHLYDPHPAAHLKPGDLRRRLIEHARDPQASFRALAEQGKRVESVFEKRVFERLHAAGYRVKPAWPVGAFRIDLVVEGTDRRLAVECDGEQWHTREELQYDMERQAVLERLGWVFVRIRGSVFFREPDKAMAPVFAKLNQLGIEALGPAAGLHETDRQLIVERVRKQAEALREQWRSAVSEGPVEEGLFAAQPSRSSVLASAEAAAWA